jgi:molecular chaperone DnaK (HSP70)
MKTLVIDIGSQTIRTVWIQANGVGQLLPDPDYKALEHGAVNQDSFTLSRVSLSDEGPYVGWACSSHSASTVWRIDLSQLWRQELVLDDWCGEWLLAVVLRKLRLNAELQLGGSVGRVLLTVQPNLPAVSQRAMQRAALWAGFLEARLLDSPLAIVALHDVQDYLPLRQNWLVADLGYRSVRLSLVERQQHQMRIVATQEDSGWSMPSLLENFQAELKREFTEQFSVQGGVQAYDSSYLLGQLLQAYADSADNQAVFPLHLFVPRGLMSVAYTQSQLQQMFKPLLDSFESLMKDILTQANLGVSDIQGILLTGGFAKLLLKQPIKLEWQRLMRCLHPRQASVFGGAFWLQQNADHGFSEQDGTCLSADFGYLMEGYHRDSSGGRFKLLLPKGTALPATVEVRDLIMRRHDISIQLAQRDSSALDNIQSLGEWPLGEMSESQQTISITITVLAEFDGILSIKTKVPSQELERWQLIDLTQADNPQAPLAVRRWLDA